MIVDGIVAVAIALSPGVHDLTYTCTVPDHGGVHPVVVEANAQSVQLQQYEPIGAPVQFFGAFGPLKKFRGGLYSDDRFCKRGAHAQFTHAGLEAQPVLRGRQALGRAGGYECWTGAAISIRVRATVDAHGKLRRAVLGVRSGARLRPVAYAVLAPGVSNAIWLAGGACHER